MSKLQMLAVLLSAASAAKPLNVVLLVIDDLGWTDVSYHGSVFPTPSIDELATTGVRLEKYYVLPVCSPTRSAIVTGRWPHKMGTQHFTTIPPGTTPHVPTANEPARSGLPETKMISELLKEQGYRTAAIGKWHLGYASWDYAPTGRGFESYTGYLQGAVDYFNKTMGVSTVFPGVPFADGMDFWKNETAFWTDNSSKGYTLQYYQHAFDTVIANQVAAGDDAKPLFLYYAMQLVHEPLEAPPAWTDGGRAQKACAHISGGVSGNRNILCQMAARMDEEVGRVVESLKQNKMWDDTVLWVSTDNGGMVDFKYDDSAPTSASSNWPLRAGKATLFEGGVRGIGFVNGGANIGLADSARGAVRMDSLHAVDVTTTLVPLALRSVVASGDVSEATRAQIKEVEAYLDGVDGVDAWGVIARGEAGGHAEIPVNINPRCRTCVDVKLSPYEDFVPGYDIPGTEPIPYNALIQGDWKIMEGFAGIYDGWWPNNATDYTREPPPPQDTNVSVRLYNLKDDEHERHNVAAEHPDIVVKLRARIAFHADPKNGFVAPQQNVPHPDSLPSLHNGTWAPFVRKQAKMLKEPYPSQA